MNEEFPNVKTIDLKNGSRIYVNTDEAEYKHVEGKSLDVLMLDEKQWEDRIKPRTWICKVCKLDNQGVICSNCHKWYNQADPDCFLK